MVQSSIALCLSALAGGVRELLANNRCRAVSARFCLDGTARTHRMREWGTSKNRGGEEGAFVFRELTRVDAVMYVEQLIGAQHYVLERQQHGPGQPTGGPWRWLYLTVDGYSNLATGREISHSQDTDKEKEEWTAETI